MQEVCPLPLGVDTLAALRISWCDIVTQAMPPPEWAVRSWHPCQTLRVEVCNDGNPARGGARVKRISDSQIIGEAGVALIALRTADMGHVWHQRFTDAGIDGEIELRDPGTGAMSNRIVLVQSKASRALFPGETTASFHYLVDTRDLEYWLGGNAPVVLICSHPDNHEAWWVHLNEWFDDPLRRASRKVQFDKDTQAFDSTAAEAIARLGARPGTGIYLGVPPRRETLVSNLMPLRRVPNMVHSAPVSENRIDKLGPALRAAGLQRSDWVLRHGRVISFRPLDEPVWSSWLTSQVMSEPAEQWLGSEDPEVHRATAELLTRTLRDSLHDELAWQPKKRLLYFKATQRLGPRTIRGKARERVVFKAYMKKGDPTQIAYYRHAALSVSYLQDDDVWYAQLDPSYLFTRDGREEARYAADHLAGIKRLERSAAVEGSVQMWASYLRGDMRRLGDPDRVLGWGELLRFASDHGIDDRHWVGKPKRASTLEEEQSAGVISLDDYELPIDPSGASQADDEDDDWQLL